MSRSQERYQASLPLLNTNLVHPNNQHLNDDDDDDDITPTTATGPIRTSYPPSFADSSPKRTHDPLPYTARIPPSSSRTHSSSRPISYGIEHELEPYRDDANSPWDPRPPLERDGSSFPRIDYTRSISPNPPTVVAGRGIKSMVSSRELGKFRSRVIGPEHALCPGSKEDHWIGRISRRAVPSVAQRRFLCPFLTLERLVRCPIECLCPKETLLLIYTGGLSVSCLRWHRTDGYP